jgi:hypothetical protein
MLINQAINPNTSHLACTCTHSSNESTCMLCALFSRLLIPHATYVKAMIVQCVYDTTTFVHHVSMIMAFGNPLFSFWLHPRYHISSMREYPSPPSHTPGTHLRTHTWYPPSHTHLVSTLSHTWYPSQEVQFDWMCMNYSRQLTVMCAVHNSLGYEVCVPS